MRVCLLVFALIAFSYLPAFCQNPERPVTVLSQQDGVVCREGEETLELASGAERNFAGVFEIRTDKTGRAALDYQGEAKIILRPATWAKADPRSITLNTGQGWMKFQKRGSSFQIKTPCAVLGIRGTTFRVDVQGQERTTVDLIEGRLAIESEGHAFILTGGQRAICRPGVAPQVVLVADELSQEAAEMYPPAAPTGPDLNQLQQQVESQEMDGRK